MDNSWRETESLFGKPAMRTCIWFVVGYVIALNFACPEVCNIALVSMIVDFLIAVSYQYMEKMDQYLEMNDGVCKVRSIPYRRILGIGKVFLFCYLFFLVLTVIPAWMTRDYREYNDIRAWKVEHEVNYAELDVCEEPQMVSQDATFDPIESEGEIKEQPFIVTLLFYVVAALIVLGFIGNAIRSIYGEIKAFARNVKEEDDKVEMLEEEDREENIQTGRFLFRKSDEEKVRRQYRRYIRKHRKDRPEPYETPEEIEIAAGVADTEEGKELHGQYERVRYGR